MTFRANLLADADVTTEGVVDQSTDVLVFLLCVVVDGKCPIDVPGVDARDAGGPHIVCWGPSSWDLPPPLVLDVVVVGGRRHWWWWGGAGIGGGGGAPALVVVGAAAVVVFAPFFRCCRRWLMPLVGPGGGNLVAGSAGRGLGLIILLWRATWWCRAGCGGGGLGVVVWGGEVFHGDDGGDGGGSG